MERATRFELATLSYGREGADWRKYLEVQCGRARRQAAAKGKDGLIRPIVALIKSLASALSIGSGGSVGREGPIIQVGAAFGSTLGQLIAMPVRQRAVLIAAGAGGGIAATFNTPIGGIAFAVELMLPFVTAPTLLVVALSSVVATYIGRFYFGALPSFNVPSLSLIEGGDPLLSVLPWFALFGLLIGVLAWALTRGIYWFEDLFNSMPGNYTNRQNVRPISGATVH